MCLVYGCLACTDIGDDIRNGTFDLSLYGCLSYDKSGSTFDMLCSFAWSERYKNDCIILKANEVFQGNGHAINLTGVCNWEGLFRISDCPSKGGPSSLEDAPVIRDVHMVGGETSGTGGFVVQSWQNHFIVRRSSSSGVIQGQSNPDRGGGGICGHGCGGDILITNCSSSGEIHGGRAGGIAGRQVGNGDNNTVTLIHCYSTGDIVGTFSGGISGWGTGREKSGGMVYITLSYSTGTITGAGCGGISGWGTGIRGNVFIAHSHSTGSIVGAGGGGICGQRTGAWDGNVTIEQCHSVGEISGQGSGGITGRLTAADNGHVSIKNCYSHGNITGSTHTGGSGTALRNGIVILTNVYASGQINQDNGGLIGRIRDTADKITITMSVYNGGSETSDMIGLNEADDKDVTKLKNSGDLTDITGTVYCYRGEKQECWNNGTIWHAVNHELPILLPPPTPSPTVTPTPTETPTQSPSPSQKPRRILFTQLPVQRPCCRVANRV